ncbi:alpha/beta fold hydrolase, partial [Stigmatella aurantiaca]|uniref:alpha/beta fold hydrolase n=1 Tax=Stigmatella aurantiaca TaxID=41 RepID=UPI001E400941
MFTSVSRTPANGAMGQNPSLSGRRRHVQEYGDNGRRYRFVTEALVADGFAVHGFDYRGHGSADGPRGFCTRWPEYLDDLTLAWERMRKAAGGQKLFLLGHSHGGLMVAHFLERGAEGVAGAVLSAPYFKLALAAPVAKRAAARMGSRVFPSLRIKSGLKPEDLSHDPEVIRMTRE